MKKHRRRSHQFPAPFVEADGEIQALGSVPLSMIRQVVKHRACWAVVGPAILLLDWLGATEPGAFDPVLALTSRFFLLCYPRTEEARQYIMTAAQGLERFDLTLSRELCDAHDILTLYDADAGLDGGVALAQQLQDWIFTAGPTIN